MTVHMSPSAAVIAVISVLISAYAHKRTRGDLIGPITAGAAIFAVLCVVISGVGESGSAPKDSNPSRPTLSD